MEVSETSFTEVKSGQTNKLTANIMKMLERRINGKEMGKILGNVGSGAAGNQGRV